MKKSFKKYFIPNEGNNHKPYFLREKSVSIIASVAIFLLLASLLGSYVVNNSKFLANIQSAFLVDLANEERSVTGSSRLVVNEKLVLAAQLKANDMAEKSYFAHTSPEGITPWHWFGQAEYQYVYAGENLAVNFSRAEDVQRAWMNSPLHRANILNNRYKEVGIATADGYYKGRQATFVVQMFGTPSAGMLNSLTQNSTSQNTNQTQVVEASTLPLELVAGESVSASPTPSPTPAPTPVQTQPVSQPSQNSLALNTQEENQPALPEPVVVAQAETPAPVSENIAGEEDAQETELKAYTNWFQRLLVSPGKVVDNAYTILFALILLSLVLKIFVAIKKQHPKNIFYGVLLLLLVLVFMYLNQNLFSAPEVISIS